MDASGQDRVKREEPRHWRRERRPGLQTRLCEKGLLARAQTQASDPKVGVSKPVRPVLPVTGLPGKIRKQKLRERGPGGRFVPKTKKDITGENL